MTIERLEVVGIKELFLDEKNPRLPTGLSRSQKDMVIYIARNTSITELMNAISENDYFPGEPMVAVPRDAGGYWVVEGNRRLTALKLLQDPSLYPRNKRVQEIAEEAKFRPEAIPCVIFDDRTEVVNYLGYRHISGVKQWEPLAKARYIAQYFDSMTSAQSEPRERYKEAARGIGSQGPFIKRQLDAFAIYNHIESNDFFEWDDLNEESISFSLLSTAVGYESVLDFVSNSEHPYLEPDTLDPNNVRDLAYWLYATNRNGETVLGDSRNIKRLAVVVSDEDGLRILRGESDLDRAFEATKGVAVEFFALLGEAEDLITQAVGQVALIDLDDGHRSKIDDIFKQARALKRVSEET